MQSVKFVSPVGREHLPLELPRRSSGNQTPKPHWVETLVSEAKYNLVHVALERPGAAAELAEQQTNEQTKMGVIC